MQRKSSLPGDLFGRRLAKVQPRTWATLLALVLGGGILALGSCKPKPPPDQAKARLYEGQVVRVACPTGPTAEVLKEYSQGWRKQTGALVEILTYDPRPKGEEPPDADLWVIAAAQLPRLAAGGLLQPVPGSFTAGSGSYGWEK